jgi:membrane-bound serine protease (ClpP class)
MRRLATGLGLLLIAQLARAEPPTVRFVDFEATVNPWTALRITRAIDEAEAAGDGLVLVRLDTPGGIVDSMEKIVKRMLNAKIPIVVWVGPSGAHAASAGFFVLIAADVAAMAPGTRTGAASSVILGGENRDDDVMLRKMNEDLAALIRSIAERRGRKIEAAEKAVFEAKAYEESVALASGLVDLVAASREELLERLDGREVRRFDGSTAVLRTKDARFVSTEFSLRHELLELLAQPEVAYLLFLVGLLGLYVEFSHPGLILPGVVGALSLLLFAFNAQFLPVNAVGVLLILLAIVMFILEIKITSYGLLTFGGLVSLVLGSLMLFGSDEPLERIPELQVPPMMVLPVSLTMAAICIVALQLALRAHRARVGTGVEGLPGETGTVTETLGPEGRVFVHGEIWNAVSAGGALPAGTRIRVVSVDDLKLVVEPASNAAADDRS